MDAKGMFLEHYELNAWYVDDFVLAGLTADQLRSAPAAGQNSVAWLVWHSTRWEDIWTNTWIVGQPQEIDRGKWLEQMHVEDRSAGTGWTPEDCAEFNRRVNCDALLGYRAALRNSTREVVARLTVADLDDTVGESTLRLAVPDGAYDNDRAPYLNGLYENRTKAWYLSLTNIHNSEHSVGEALCVRSQGGFALGL